MTWNLCCIIITLSLAWKLLWIIYLDVQCPVIEPVPYRIQYGYDTGYDDTITFTCVPGYAFADGSGSRTTTCQSNGLWSDGIEECLSWYPILNYFVVIWYS